MPACYRAMETWDRDSWSGQRRHILMVVEKKKNLIDELKKSLKIRLYVKYNQNPYINRDKTQPLV